jgi:hypothetical protein
MADSTRPLDQITGLSLTKQDLDAIAKEVATLLAEQGPTEALRCVLRYGPVSIDTAARVEQVGDLILYLEARYQRPPGEARPSMPKLSQPPAAASR